MKNTSQDINTTQNTSQDTTTAHHTTVHPDLCRGGRGRQSPSPFSSSSHAPDEVIQKLSRELSEMRKKLAAQTTGPTLTDRVHDSTREAAGACACPGPGDPVHGGVQGAGGGDEPGEHGGIGGCGAEADAIPGKHYFLHKHDMNFF